ncbi:hypothetical protein [Actinokineospora globicatena]|uniref:Uncharacterized protein n=1 Tax=Actinokineospora globicatena TaxID=103729 RepID=A0A9W6QJG6_9PSEU|nr:hypothetical protein [Actinokineospora globicatena]GLW89729.1 hypothetical protein Aglo03_05450 [Actinokineospora globicatena]
MTNSHYSFYQDRTYRDPTWTTQVNGHRAHVDDTSAALDCTDYILTIDVKPTHKNRYRKAELQKILDNLTIQTLKTKPTWFDAPTALRP